MATPSAAQILIVVQQPENPQARFQLVESNSGNTTPRIVNTFATQGEITSWLLGNGYRWVTDSQPQQWVKD